MPIRRGGSTSKLILKRRSTWPMARAPCGPAPRRGRTARGCGPSSGTTPGGEPTSTHSPRGGRPRRRWWCWSRAARQQERWTHERADDPVAQGRVGATGSAHCARRPSANRGLLAPRHADRCGGDPVGERTGRGGAAPGGGAHRDRRGICRAGGLPVRRRFPAPPAGLAPRRRETPRRVRPARGTRGPLVNPLLSPRPQRGRPAHRVPALLRVRDARLRRPRFHRHSARERPVAPRLDDARIRHRARRRHADVHRAVCVISRQPANRAKPRAAGRRGLGDQPCGGRMGHPQAVRPSTPRGREAAHPAPQRVVLRRDVMKTALGRPPAPAAAQGRPWRGELRSNGRPDGARTLPRHRSRPAVAVALAAVVALLGVLARPSPPSLSTQVTGDATLAARARPLLPGALDRVSLAVVDGATVTHAGFGADEHTEYEIGSLTKTFTALLLADAIRRGEVTADTKVGA